MAVWDVGDTAASFYNAIDVNFSGDNATVTPDPEPEVDPFTEVGLISGAIALESGDVMTTLVYDERGELPALSVSYTADSYLSGGAAALELARAINDADLGYYAGQRDGEAFVPAVGQNRIYSDSGVTNVEVRVDYVRTGVCLCSNALGGVAGGDQRHGHDRRALLSRSMPIQPSQQLCMTQRAIRSLETSGQLAVRQISSSTCMRHLQASSLWW